MSFEHPGYRLLAGAVVLLAAGAASAQDNTLKIGLTDYTTHSKSDGITGIGVPPGADAETGNAITGILVYERLFSPNVGAELVIGIPPRIKAKASGSVAYLGDDVLSAKILSPTVFVNYHFGAPGDVWRPYLGLGINHTKFVGIESRIASQVQMSSSTGWAVHAGLHYAIDDHWGLFANVAALRVKSKLVATGANVLQTTIEFHPVVYTLGAAYSF